jgi:hypothetical protein
MLVSDQGWTRTRYRAGVGLESAGSPTSAWPEPRKVDRAWGEPRSPRRTQTAHRRWPEHPPTRPSGSRTNPRSHECYSFLLPPAGFSGTRSGDWAHRQTRSAGRIYPTPPAKSCWARMDHRPESPNPEVRPETPRIATWPDNLQIVILLVPGITNFPAQAVIERQIRSGTPVVLPK